MSKKGIPKAPGHLSAKCKKLWSEVLCEVILEPHNLELLRLALESLDRCDEARLILKRDGLCVIDRYGTQKAHPMLSVEKDAKATFSKLVSQLNLDVEIVPTLRHYTQPTVKK